MKEKTIAEGLVDQIEELAPVGLGRRIGARIGSMLGSQTAKGSLQNFQAAKDIANQIQTWRGRTQIKNPTLNQLSQVLGDVSEIAKVTRLNPDSPLTDANIKAVANAYAQSQALTPAGTAAGGGQQAGGTARGGQQAGGGAAGAFSRGLNRGSGGRLGSPGTGAPSRAATASFQQIQKSLKTLTPKQIVALQKNLADMLKRLNAANQQRPNQPAPPAPQPAPTAPPAPQPAPTAPQTPPAPPPNLPESKSLESVMLREYVERLNNL